MHIADKPHQEKIARTINLADNLDFINDADLTSLTAAKAAVDTNAASKHIADRQHVPNIHRALEMAADVDSASVTGEDIDDIRDALPAVDGHTGRLLH